MQIYLSFEDICFPKRGTKGVITSYVIGGLPKQKDIDVKKRYAHC